MTPHPLAMLEQAGAARYGGEAVSQLDHALQSAALAAREGASDALVVAALLHDLGHLAHPDSDAASRAGRDLRHEQVGARLLARWFPPAVTEPVRLHVQAKRLLARDPGYAAALSEESVRTLALQGGPFDDTEAAAFRALPFAEDAVRMRRWDDAAKIVGLVVPPLASWAPLLRGVAWGAMLPPWTPSSSTPSGPLGPARG